MQLKNINAYAKCKTAVHFAHHSAYAEHTVSLLSQSSGFHDGQRKCTDYRVQQRLGESATTNTTKNLKIFISIVAVAEIIIIIIQITALYMKK